MAYKKIRLEDAPKIRRNRPSRFESSQGWRQMKADLERGLKSKEALSLSLDEDDKRKLGISNRRTIARFLQKYLSAHDLPYELKSYHRDGLDFFLIQNWPKN